MLAAAITIAFSGCASDRERDTVDEPSHHNHTTSQQQHSTAQDNGDVRRVKSDNGKVDGFIRGTPARNSKFLRLKIGMSIHEVTELIGQGGEQRAYITGKSFIPFYFGRDTSRFEVLYEGLGTLVYSHRGGYYGRGGYGILVGINHDESETGYNSRRHNK